VKTLKITREYLEHHLACVEQLECFEESFPDGVILTVELALQHAQTFDWAWAIENLLEGDVQYTALHQEYEVFRRRDEACNAINEAYNMQEQHTPEEVKARLAAIQETKHERQRQLASVFASAFILQGGRELMEGEAA
jgi:hypothetical protein